MRVILLVLGVFVLRMVVQRYVIGPDSLDHQLQILDHYQHCKYGCIE